MDKFSKEEDRMLLMLQKQYPWDFVETFFGGRNCRERYNTLKSSIDKVSEDEDQENSTSKQAEHAWSVIDEISKEKDKEISTPEQQGYSWNVMDNLSEEENKEIPTPEQQGHSPNAMGEFFEKEDEEILTSKQQGHSRSAMGEFSEEEDEEILTSKQQGHSRSAVGEFSEEEDKEISTPEQQEHSRSVMGEFSEEEDKEILGLKKEGHSWAYIADFFGGRDCRERYRTHASKKDKMILYWTPSEEQLLAAFGTEKVDLKWDIISEYFEERSTRACRQMWTQNFKYAPEKSTEIWTEDEIKQLRQLRAAGKNWQHMSVELAKVTGLGRRKAGECLQWWLQFEDAFAYPTPVPYPHSWTPERKELVQRLRGQGETWEHIAKQVSATIVPPDAYQTPEVSINDCRSYWYSECWEVYRLWMRADGTLNLQ